MFEDYVFVFIDLDFFKLINDIYGYDVGDIVLKVMVVFIEFYFLDEIIFCFGGEEFCIYMLLILLKEVCECLDDFRKVVEVEII